MAVAASATQRKSNEKLLEYRKIEAEVQRQWNESRISEVDAPSDNKGEKFFATFPYPYMNGKLHLGHSFSISKVEFAIRYQQLLGKKCLFPLGFHCTGMPILACADKLKREIELFGNPPTFPADTQESNIIEGQGDKKLDIDDVMAKDKSKAKKSKAQAKSGGAKYQWQIMRDNIKLNEADIKGLSEDEIASKIDEEISKFVDPTYWFKYFPDEAMKDLKSFGLAIDWRRAFVTTDVNPFYDSFVKWQFVCLRKRNKIKFGKRYSIFSPKDNQPCMDHDRATGEGVAPQEYTLIKVRLLEPADISALQTVCGKSIFLLAATLRPETMFGQTNLWLKPDMKYVAFKMINDEIGVCSLRAAMNMSYQDLTPQIGNVEIVAELTGQDLLGQKLDSPNAPQVIYSLPMMSIKDDKGTGIVTSVPSDSPDDWMALKDLKKKSELRQKFNISDNIVLNIEAIPIIEVPDYGSLSAERVCEAKKINSQNDRDLLAEAKELVYLKGFYDGKMLVPSYEGKKVNEVRKPIQKLMIDQKQAILYMEPEKQVISRSGDECVVALCDQWYLDYEDEAWKNQVRDALKRMQTYSDETRTRFEMTIDWLHGHACSRTYGLGSKLPWDEKWLIESLSDSTIYMAYYTIVHLLQAGKLVGDDNSSPLGIKPSQMNSSAWNFIFFGDETDLCHCSIPRASLEVMRREFLFWYPMDLRSSGKDLVPNHLTYSIYNHCAIWDKEPDKWPISFRANGHLLLNNEKMSKSTGNFLTLEAAIEIYGADAVRFALADSGDGIDDANFATDLAENGLLKLFNYYKWCEETLASIENLRTGDIVSYADKAFECAMHRKILDTKEQYDNMMFKLALKCGYHEYQDLRSKYKEMCGEDGMHASLVKKFITTQAILLHPICPHISQRIWTLLGNNELLAMAKWPEVTTDEVLYKSYVYLNEAVHKFRVSLKDFQKPPKSKAKSASKEPRCATKATIFVARTFPTWQATICQVLHDLYIEHNGTIPEDKVISKKLAECETLKGYDKKRMPFAVYRKGIISELGEEAFNLTLPFEESQVLQANLEYLKASLELSDVTIQDSSSSDDPKILEDCCPSEPKVMFS